MITVTDPLNRRTSYAYDAVSNQRTDAQGIATTYSYDLRYLPTGVQYPDDVLITNSYDAICQQTVKNANDALTTYT